MEKGKISFILPVYNGEKTIEKCIKSVINQKIKNYELIIIDDESKDKTGEICQKYVNENIKYFYQKNTGQGIARNFGMKVATGEYITFIDSDDYIEKNSYKDILPYLKKDYDYIMFSFFIETEKSKYKENFVNKVVEFSANNVDIINGMLVNRGPYAGLETSVWNKIYRKDIIEKNNIQFKSERKYLSEDSIFNYDYYKHSKRGIIIPKTIYCYVQNNSSYTHKYQLNYDQRTLDFYYYLENNLEGYNKEIQEKIKSIIVYKCFMGYKLCLSQEIYYNNKKDLSSLLSNSEFLDIIVKVDKSYLSKFEKILFYFIKIKFKLGIIALFEFKQTLKNILKRK